MMQRDLRSTALFREVEAFFAETRRPGEGRISDAVELSMSPDGRSAAFAGTIMDRLEGFAQTRICVAELASRDVRVLTQGSHCDRLPKYSPDGGMIAYLTDAEGEGSFQLALLDPAGGESLRAPPVHGWVEYFHWSPDGTRILLAVAGHGADISGGQGAVASRRDDEGVPGWMPTVETGDESFRWRSAWIYELAGNSVRRVELSGMNLWEMTWCGNDAIVSVVSDRPGEGHWYGATLARFELGTGQGRMMLRPADQLGWPSCSPSGDRIAVVEAVCSDRWLVAGDLRIIEVATGAVRSVDTKGVDVTFVEWRSDNVLLVGGHRGPDTVAGWLDCTSSTFVETWSNSEITTGGFYFTASGVGTDGDFGLIGQGFRAAPEIGLVTKGRYEALVSFDLGYAEHAQAIGTAVSIDWAAPDGRPIQGWLVTPKGRGPFPLVMVAHGGPVWQSRPMWLGRSALLLLLIKRGYAIFFPNPRGSSGFGQDFARAVKGDMGGKDTHDCLSGLDALVARGVADPERLGVIGASYGGFLTSWLITQVDRFAAAIPIAPVTNQVTEHLISTIPHFVELFLDDRFDNPGGRYFDRSPLMHARKVKTPTLNICGDLDRVTPPEEAVQFHNALLESGVKSVLVRYPGEGHGIRGFPAVIDYSARAIAWFDEHMSA
jgi:dipeptidyl aminopeptidase/acylaminoacyl peptidase